MYVCVQKCVKGSKKKKKKDLQVRGLGHRKFANVTEYLKLYFPKSIRNWVVKRTKSRQ